MQKQKTNKKAAFDAANIGSGKGIISQPDTNTLAHYKGRAEKEQAPTVEQFLTAGAENALSTQELMALLQCGSVRQLRQMVEDERRAGALILSGPGGGYFLPDTGQKGREELQRQVDITRARALAMLATSAPARKALRKLDGQVKMEDKCRSL